MKHHSCLKRSLCKSCVHGEDRPQSQRIRNEVDPAQHILQSWPRNAELAYVELLQ